MIDTRKVSGRRRLRFTDHQQVVEEARRLAGLPTRQLGNLSLGQICQHLAVAIEHSIDADKTFRVPLKTRILARWFRSRILEHGLPAGFRLPPEGAEVLIPGEVTPEIGLAALEPAIVRLQTTKTRVPHPAFGAMSVAQWDKFHLRHAEMHLSFIVPE